MTASPATPTVSHLAILTGLPAVGRWEEEFYRELHARPELSHQPTVTSSKVAARLRDGGYEVHEHLGGTGVVGVLPNGDGPTVLVPAIPVNHSVSFTPVIQPTLYTGTEALVVAALAWLGTTTPVSA